MKHNTNIVLIGLPGSGKTTVGMRLARLLEMPFIDTDTMIEDDAGLDIPSIFELYGEQVFRQMERKAILQVSMVRGVIISTGGGAWEDPENRDRLKQVGMVVYLQGSPEVLWDRLAAETAGRPLLSQGYQRMEELYMKRHPQYLLADAILPTDGKDPDRLAAEILEMLGAYVQRSQAGISPVRLTVNTKQRDYQVIIGYNVIDCLGQYIGQIALPEGQGISKACVFTNPLVKSLCADRVIKSLAESGIEANIFITADGEEHKSLEQAAKAYKALARHGLDRQQAVIALGGGVVGDLAGFVASTYMRGIRLIQVPTTLLAQVDSSIGGKNAVNLAEGKNLVGTFHQPEMVISDLGLIAHLPDTQYRQGLAECIKYGVIDEKGLFDYLEENTQSILDRDIKTLMKVISRCCSIKGCLVAEDELDCGSRMLLNLGHTIGHGLEAACGYGRVGHGDAVMLGLKAEAYISNKMGILDNGNMARIGRLIDGMGFSKRLNFSTRDAISFIEKDKKKSKGKIRMVLPAAIGRAVITALPDNGLVEEALCFIGGR